MQGFVRGCLRIRRNIKLGQKYTITFPPHSVTSAAFFINIWCFLQKVFLFLSYSLKTRWGRAASLTLDDFRPRPISTIFWIFFLLIGLNFQIVRKSYPTNDLLRYLKTSLNWMSCWYRRWLTNEGKSCFEMICVLSRELFYYTKTLII